ncbi:DNA-binding response regulator [Prosthecomicrobium hirschii]|uniref:response regulator transcription factor n=1 Tax=Prosthecodimorpha hirschii TaxID=665126 RepID=UPI0011299F7C|nr:response regulator transcription factor [Prosthecomicrobium hirschii]TPQ49957.1 DNA-binding response regulator [Prosthecomicrobium hirschii]
MRVMLVEDEKAIANDIAEGLGEAGYVVDVVHDGEEAWFRGETEDYDAIVIDLGLPKLDGLSVVRRLRAAKVTTPVLVLTARGAWMERVEGIDAGADDYLVKPFEMAELTARCRALLRRPGATLGTVLTAGAVSLDTAAREARVGGRAIDMPRREIDCLEVLLRRAGQVVPRPALEERLYAFDDEVTPNALEAVISRLRRRLADAGSGLDIHTVRGIGYLAREKAPRREGR